MFRHNQQGKKKAGDAALAAGHRQEGTVSIVVDSAVQPRPAGGAAVRRGGRGGQAQHEVPRVAAAVQAGAAAGQQVTLSVANSLVNID